MGAEAGGAPPGHSRLHSQHIPGCTQTLSTLSTLSTRPSSLVFGRFPTFARGAYSTLRVERCRINLNRFTATHIPEFHDDLDSGRPDQADSLRPRLKQGEARRKMEGDNEEEEGGRCNDKEKEKVMEERERKGGRLLVHSGQPSASERTRFSMCEEHLLHIGQG